MKGISMKGGKYIMEWFESVKGTVKKTAEKAYEKSSQLIEVTKLNFSISEMEAAANKLFQSLGEIVFSEFKAGAELGDDSKLMCESIQKKFEEIEDLKQQLAELKNVKKCEKCGKENLDESRYCMQCGEKLAQDEGE